MLMLFLGKLFISFELITDKEYLSEKFISIHLGGVLIFLNALTVASPPHIILESDFADTSLVISTLVS